MPKNNTILVTVDTVRNIVRLSFVGDIGVEESRSHEKAISDAIAAARPGFFLLTDLSELTSMDVDCMSSIIRTMEAARSRGIARVVRVIPDISKDIGFNIMSLFHYPHGVQIITCENQTAAEGALK